MDDMLASVVIETLPAVGALTLSGAAVTEGQTVAVDEIPNLVFTPAENGNGSTATTGSPYATFMFKVHDGRDSSAAAYTLSIDVTAVNDAPASADSTVSTNEDTPYPFSAADFAFDDPDTLDTLAGVTIVDPPTVGTLALDGAAVMAGQTVPAGDIPSLVFTPAPHANGAGYASFMFKVTDAAAAESAVADTMTIDVAAVNDPATGRPTITGTAAVGETLAAAPGDIADVDGLASPTYSYQWYRVDPDDSSRAPIDNATMPTYTLTDDDGGKTVAVEARFTDDAGGAEMRTSDATDTVVTVPGMPQTLTAAPGDMLVVLTWAAPTNNGGAAITNYRYRHAQGATVPDTAAWTDVADGPDADSDAGNEITVTVPNLVNDMEYAFEVVAVNGVGQGGPAGASATPTPVPNTAPTSAHRTVTVDEDTAYTFSAADFAFSDGVDAVDDVLERMIVETPPAVGVLKLGSAVLTSGATVPADQIGTLVFTPAENGHGSTATTGSPYATFMFKVHDGRDSSAAAYTMTIDVTPVNDEPTGLLTIAGTLTVGQTLTADISAVSDADGLPDSPSGFTYAWTRTGGVTDAVSIAGATEVNYTLVDADAGRRIRVVVFYTDNDGTDEKVRSEAYPVVGHIAAIVPGKPRGLAATPGNGQVTLEWTEPSSNGGASVTGYEYRYSEGSTVDTSATWTAVADSDDFGTGTDDEREVTVTGLVNDTLYAFEVRARNRVGPGPASDPMTATPREGPQLAATPAVEGMRLTLTFNGPLDPGSVPETGDFAVTVEGAPVTVDEVNVVGTTVVLTLARPAAHGEAWRVSYTRPATNPLQNAAGEPATVPPGQIVTNATPDTTKPAPGAAPTVDGAVLTLTYGEPLDEGSVPAPGDFAVTVEGTPVPVTDVGVNGATVTLTLASPAQSGQPVTLGYSPGASPLQDLAGNEADRIPAGPAVNITADETPPVFQSATVDGTFVTLTYDEPLDEGSVPRKTAFAVIVGSRPRVTVATVKTVEVDGPSVVLTLAEAVAPGQAVRLHYAVDRAKPIRDPAGNRAAALSDEPVAHAPAGAPRVVAVKVTSTPGLSAPGAAADTYGPGETIAFSVTFSAAVTVRGVPAFAFALANPGAASGARRAAYDTARSSATALVFTYTVVAADEDTDGIAWAPDALAPGAAGIAGRAAAVVSHSARGPLAGHKVDGSRADSAAPAPAGATVDGTVLTLTFEEALDAGSVPAPGDFTVRVPHLTAWGETLTLLPNVDAVTVSGRAAVLTLWQPVRFGETAVTLEYRPGAHPLRDPAGNAAPGFARLEVVNITPDTEAPRLDPPLTLTGDELTLSWNEPLDEAPAPAPGDFTVVRSVSGTQVPVTVDAVTVDGSTVVLTLAAAAEPVWQLKAGYRPGASPLRDLVGNTAPGFAPRRVKYVAPDDRSLAQSAGQPPGIVRVAIAPDPDGDGAWEAGEAVEVTLTFDAPVEVDTGGGTPSLRALVGSTERELTYTRGSGTAALVFAWTPAAADEPATSVLLAGNALALNGGAIRGTAGLDAELAHNGAARTGVAIADDAASGTMAPSAAPDETAEADEAAEADTADEADEAAEADTADTADAVDAPVRAPFGASFSAVPREHDGAAAFTLTLVFGAEPAGLSYRTVRDSLLRVSGATVTKARRLAPPSNRRYELTVAPAGNAPVRLKLGSSPACSSAGAVCTADGRALTGSVSVTVPGPAALTLADASVREAPGAVLVFRISLNRRRHAAVTVDYATADGGARAGADYIRRSGTLVFAAGERVKTVGVEVLDDSEDDDGETLTLSLSNARGAIIADGTATGTIHNSDPLPKGWLVRFGRAGAVQVLELLDDRFDEAAAGPNQLTLGGRPVHIPFRRTQQGTQGTDLQGPGTDLQRPGTDWQGPGTDWQGPGTDWQRPGTDWQRPGTDWQGPGTDLSPSPEVQEVEGQTREATLLERGLWTLLSNRGHLQFDQRRFLSQSSFDLSLTDLLKQGTQAPGTEARGTEAPGTEARGTDLSPSPESHWSLWGRGALTHFSGADTGVTIDGDVLTGLLGVDYARPRWLAGVALAYHDGDGSYRSSRNGRTGALDSTLVSVNPYLRYALTERLSAWGALGYGAGTLRLSPTIAGDGLGQMGSDLSLTPAIAGDVIETDMQMGMGALGLRGVVYANAHTELALKSDAMWVRTASAETAGLRAVAAADSSRLRLLLSGRHRRVLTNAALLSPSFELGIRYDDGAAETGFGMELGAGLRYADPVWGLTVAATARTLVAHADGGYEEWGLSGSLALDPGRLGRGLALRLDSGWGLTDSGTEALWQRQTAAGLAPQHNRAAPGRIRVEMGYGLDVPWTYGMLTPYSGVELAGGRRTLRLGWRFTLGQSLILSLDGERRETGHAAPEHALMLRTTLPW